MRKRLLALGLIAGFAALALAAQAPPPVPAQPTFKSQVEYVEVDVLVTNQQGQFVRDLTRDDFDLREDGKTQSIATFSLVDIPVEKLPQPLFASRPVEPDIGSNERPFDGRVYVLLLDDLHIDAQRSPRVKAAAREFISGKLGANDLMAIVTSGGRSDASQPFTGNKRLLTVAVDRFTGRKVQPTVLDRNAQLSGQAIAGNPGLADDPHDAERLHDAELTLRSIRDVADWVGGVRGRRKTVLLVTEGLDIEGAGQNGSSRGGASLLDGVNEAIGAAQRSNVSIYGIDPRGLTGSFDDTISSGSFPEAGGAAARGPRSSTGVPDGFGAGSLTTDLRLSHDTLRRLSEETGGVAIVDRNDYAPAFDRIVADNSSYYLLAYYPAADKRDGKFHKIEVKVKSRSGLAVRARRGYRALSGKAPAPAAGGGASPEVREAMSSLLPVSGLSMRMFAAPFKGIQPNASVLLGVEMSGRDLSLDPGGALEVSYAAEDAEGKPRGVRLEKVTMNVSPETKAAISEGAFRVLSRMDLAPGRYQLHVASRDAANNAVGSVAFDLEVPDYYKQPFSMSGLVLASLSGSSIVTARPDQLLKEVLPAPPTAVRAFAQNDELALFTEVYENSGSAPHKVDLATVVTSEAGTVVFKNEEQRDSSELQGQRGGYGYQARVALADLKPGAYVLRVEARSQLSKDAPFAREILFRVVPPTEGGR